MNFFEKIYNTGLSEENSNSLNNKIRVVNYAALFGFVFLYINVAFNMYNGTYLLSLSDIATSPLLLLIIFLNKKKAYTAARFLLLYVLPAALWPFNYLLEDVASQYYLFSIMILSYYLLDKKINRIISITYLSVIFLSIMYMLEFGLTLEMYPEIRETFYWINAVGSIFCLATISSVYSNENKAHVSGLNIKNSELKKQNDFIKELLKELNHRVKNNLQLISSLFFMQSLKIKDKKLNSIFNETRNRVDSIAILHQHIYSDNISISLDLNNYITVLVENLKQAFIQNKEVGFVINAVHEELSIEILTHIGLIVNELVTNAIKYGLNNNGQTDIIEIGISKTDKSIDIIVSDKGKGFNDSFEIGNTDTFGLELVKLISEKNNGSLKINNDNGAKVSVGLVL